VFKATVAAVVCRATAVTSFHVREDGAIVPCQSHVAVVAGNALSYVGKDGLYSITVLIHTPRLCLSNHDEKLRSYTLYL